MSHNASEWIQSDRRKALFYGLSVLAVGLGGVFCAYRLNALRNERNLIHFYKNNRRMINVGISNTKIPSLRVMSYNILADGTRYALDTAKFDYCPLKYRKWKYREKRLLAEIQAYNPDIIGLQETTYKTYENSLQFALDSIGYESIHVIRDEAAHKNGFDAQTDCIVINKDKFEIINKKIIRLNHECDKEKYEKYFGDSQSHFRCKALKKSADILVVLHLKMKNFECANYEFIACSTHLYWNPSAPHIKLSQALMINESLYDLVENEWNLNIKQTPMILCGDFNAMPCKSKPDRYDPWLKEGENVKSGVYKLMTDQIVECEHMDHPKRRIYEKIYRSIYYEMNDIDINECEETENEIIERKKKINIDELAKNVIDFDTYPQLLQLEYLKNMKDFESKIRWKSAYAMAAESEPIFTNHVPHFSETIDYIFCNDQFRVLSYLEHPTMNDLTYHIPNLDAMKNGNMDQRSDNFDEKKEKEKAKENAEKFPFLPNANYISDHLSLVTDLQFMPNEEEKMKIIQQLEST